MTQADIERRGFQCGDVLVVPSGDEVEQPAAGDDMRLRDAVVRLRNELPKTRFP